MKYQLKNEMFEVTNKIEENDVIKSELNQTFLKRNKKKSMKLTKMQTKCVNNYFR